MKISLVALVLVALSSGAAAQSRSEKVPEDSSGSVERLLRDGWEIAGYASNFDGRTLILFKHKDQTYLNQCSVFYDVTREKRVIINCYEVR